MIRIPDKDLLNPSGGEKPNVHRRQHLAHIAGGLAENDDLSDDLLSDEAKIPDRVHSQLKDVALKLREIIPEGHGKF